jgi:hypothetical protein
MDRPSEVPHPTSPAVRHYEVTGVMEVDRSCVKLRVVKVIDITLEYAYDNYEAESGHAFDNEKAAMRYQHACERFSGVSDERPAPRPRCAAGTGGSRADRRTTRPACRSARRQCPSVHPAAQWCALRRRPTHGRR